MIALAAFCEPYELLRSFSTSAGSIDCLTVLRVELQDGELRGYGECVPSAARMVSRDEGGCIAEEARTQALTLQWQVGAGLGNQELLRLMPAGPARNALDCALWDLAAKRRCQPAAKLLGIEMPEQLVTAYTISLGDIRHMHEQALQHRDYPLLKVKLGSRDDIECIAAVRRAAPDSELIVDANGAWSLAHLAAIAPRLHALGVALIEQPLPPGGDDELALFHSPVPLCADESCHVRADLDHVASRYQYINIKLDKTGGLTEAVALARAARQRGLGVMVGCMAGTSLSMAPAAVVASLADYVDLDGPLLLRSDRAAGFSYVRGRFAPTHAQLWG
jgi:L-Ala-D/L-Glu epimerase